MGTDAPEPLPLPPVTRSLLLGAAVSAGLHGMAVAEGLFARGLAAGIRRAAPGAAPVAGVVGHAAALGVTVAGLGSAMEYLNRRAEAGGSAIDAAYTSPPDVRRPSAAAPRRRSRGRACHARASGSSTSPSPGRRSPT